VGRNQAEEVRQFVHPSHIHVYAVLLLAAEQVLAVRQPERVHHVCYVRQELLHFSQTGIRPVVEERVAPSGPGQGNILIVNYNYYYTWENMVITYYII